MTRAASCGGGWHCGRPGNVRNSSGVADGLGTLARGVGISPTSRVQDLVLPVGLIASVLVILLPLPAALMDVLLTANIAIARDHAADDDLRPHSAGVQYFPSLLLATTLFRLVLNVATTRLILTRAADRGLWAAGGVIKTFGEFVAGDRIVVGLIIFAIIVLIQFIVITKGATRISEVAARFALDGMPGRQMAIDADLNAGHHRRARGPAPPDRNHPPGGFLRRHGRCQQVRPRRRHRRRS